MLQSSVDLMLLQHLIHFGVKRMTRRLGNLVGAHPQTFLLRLTLTHRHAFMTSKTFWRSHGLDFYHGLLGALRRQLVVFLGIEITWKNGDDLTIRLAAHPGIIRIRHELRRLASVASAPAHPSGAMPVHSGALGLSAQNPVWS